jgi:hypothetical protein
MKHVLRISAVTLFLTFALFSPLPVAAQSPIEGPTWTMGWATEMDSPYIVELDIDWDASGEVVGYIENTRMTQIQIELTYDFDSWVPFTFSGPESMTVDMGANETFTIKFGSINDDETREYSPSNTSTLTITAEEKVGDTTASTQELEGDIGVPKVFDLRPEITLPEEDLHAGSWIEISAQMVNNGNTGDAVKEASVQFRSCPHLSMTGVDELANTLVDPTDAQSGKDTFVTLRIDASESQQKRVCEVTLSLVSEGDDVARSSTFEIEVNAVESNQPSDSSSDSSTDIEDSDSSLTQETNALPWLGGFETLTLIGLASLRKIHDA